MGDYGGYNVNFYNNLNVVWGNKAKNEACWNIAATHFEGPSNKVYGNRCIVYNVNNEQGGPIVTVRAPTSHKGSALVMRNNSYFSVFGNTTWQMADGKGDKSLYDLDRIQTVLGFEEGSSVDVIPSNQQIVAWAKDVLNMN